MKTSIVVLAAGLAAFSQQSTVNGQEANEAEELFKKMESTLTGARGMRIRSTHTSGFKVDDMQGGVETRVVRADRITYVLPDNRFRLEEMLNEGHNLLVSDGRRMKWFFKQPKEKPHTGEGASILGKDFLRSVAIQGVNRTFSQLLAKMDPRPETSADTPTPRAFQLKESEIIEGREFRCITYSGPFAWKLWIDAKTHLPFKRMEITSDKNPGLPFTETYEFAFDVPINPNRFRIPEEKVDLAAESLFRAMEDPFVDSKTLQFHHRCVRQPEKTEAKGEILAGEEYRARIHVADKREPESSWTRFISNGREAQLTTGDGKVDAHLKSAEALGLPLRMGLADSGVARTLEWAADVASGVNSDPWAAVGFRMAGKEKVEGREAHVVEYKLMRLGCPDQVAKVWIDAALRLPLKRVLRSGASSVAEYYTEFRLDEKIDAARFEHPK